jgi:anti-anti-sigma regulatory factor
MVSQTAAVKKTATPRKTAAAKKAVGKPRAAVAGKKPASVVSSVLLDSSRAHGCQILRFGPACTLQEAPALRAALVERLAEGMPVVLDAAELTQVDTAGVQLLVGFAIDCMERDIAFCWKARSAELERAIALLGVAALLESPAPSDQFAAALAA